MRNIWTIVKKELRRFFTDKRMLASLLLPGVLIFAVYSLMGSFFTGIQTVEEDYIYKIVIVNKDDKLEEEYFSSFNNVKMYDILYLDEIDLTTKQEYKTKLSEETIDLLVIYPDNFYDDSIAFDPNTPGDNESPIVEIFYNSTRTESMMANNLYTIQLQMFQEKISEKFRVNPPGQDYDLASNESASIMIITMLVPFLLITFLFTGAMSVSIESIAGEKERGTIATLLATPMKRNDFALGKIIGLSIISLASAASSFLGLMLSLPKLMGGADLDFNIYGPSHYLMLFLVVLTTTLLYVVLISLVSAFSKSIKEATSFASVIMIVNMVIGITSMAGVSQKSYVYFIPIYNSVCAISDILSKNLNVMNLLFTSITNIGLIGLGVYFLTLMFNSEKVMFNK